jgi:hypothetical protein
LYLVGDYNINILQHNNIMSSGGSTGSNTQHSAPSNEDADNMVGTNSTEDGSVIIDPNEPIGEVDLEIVGLLSGSNGRSCSVHSECGSTVRVGDLLRLKQTVVMVDGNPEEAVMLAKITADGVEGCIVAYVPRLIVNTPTLVRNINCFCVVKELYDNSQSQFKRSKSRRNMGMAGVVLLNEIPRAE